MRRSVVLILAVAILAGGADAARAQCPTPELKGFAPPPQDPEFDAVPHFRVGSRDQLLISVAGARTVEIEWGDGIRQRVRVRGTLAAARHAYARPGRRQIVATAIAGCGAQSPPGGHTVRVFPRCELTRGPDLYQADCDRARDALRLTAGKVSVAGNWLSWPCRDAFTNSLFQDPEPVARASSCVAPLENYGVDGHLPVRPGQRARVVIGAVASRMTFSLATADEKVGRRHRARRLGKSGRRWAITLPETFGRADRVVFEVRRPAGGRDAWAAGITRG